MNDEWKNDIARLEAKIDAIYTSTEKTRRYFQITLWVTLALFILPLFGLLFAIPSFLSSYSSAVDGTQVEFLQSL